jgi:hypothetical protein
MKKKLMLIFLSLFSVPFVSADSITQMLGNVFDKILYIGSLGGNFGNVLALTRVLIWVLVFTVLFAVITGLKGQAPMKFFNKGQAGVVAGVIATIAAIFLPKSLLQATGAGWATAVAFLLIGGPVVGLGYLVLQIPGKGKDTKGTVFIKFILCLLLLWILTAMKYHVRVLS